MRSSYFWSAAAAVGALPLTSCGLAGDDSAETPEEADVQVEESGEEAALHEADSAVAAMHAGAGRVPLAFRAEDGEHIWTTISDRADEEAELDTVVLDAETLDVVSVEEGSQSRDEFAAEAYGVEYSITRALRAAAVEVGGDAVIVEARAQEADGVPQWYVEFDSGETVTMDGTGREPFDLQVSGS